MEDDDEEDEEEDPEDAMVTDDDFDDDDGADGDPDGDPTRSGGSEQVDSKEDDGDDTTPMQRDRPSRTLHDESDASDPQDPAARSKQSQDLDMEMERDPSTSATVGLSLSPLNDQNRNSLNDVNGNGQNDDTEDINGPQVGEVDLLRMMKQLESENAALRVERSTMECDHSTLRTKYEYLKYDEQLLQEQMKELHEVNCELKHQIKQMTESWRDNGILRQQLLSKETEVAAVEKQHHDLHRRHRQLQSDFATLTQIMDVTEQKRAATVENADSFQKYASSYWFEYLWTEYGLIRDVEAIYEEMIGPQNNGNRSRSVSSMLSTITEALNYGVTKTIEIEDDTESVSMSKSQKRSNGMSTEMISNVDRLSFSNKSKMRKYICSLGILPKFTANHSNDDDDDNDDGTESKEDDSSNRNTNQKHHQYHHGLTTYSSQSGLFGAQSLCASVQLPPLLKRTEFVFIKLLTKIAMLSSSQRTNASDTALAVDDRKAKQSNLTESTESVLRAKYERLLAAKERQRSALEQKCTEITDELTETKREKEDIYWLFSEYKKERSVLKKRITSLEQEIAVMEEDIAGYRQIAQQLAETEQVC